jgi:hypothetical protein
MNEKKLRRIFEIVFNGETVVRMKKLRIGPSGPFRRGGLRGFKRWTEHSRETLSTRYG